MFPNQGEVKSAGGGCVVCWSLPTLFPCLHAGYTSHWKYEPFKMNSSYTEPSLHQNKQKPAHNLRGRVHIHSCSPGSEVAGNLPDPLTNTQWPSFRPPRLCECRAGWNRDGRGDFSLTPLARQQKAQGQSRGRHGERGSACGHVGVPAALSRMLTTASLSRPNTLNMWEEMPLTTAEDFLKRVPQGGKLGRGEPKSGGILEGESRTNTMSLKCT